MMAGMTLLAHGQDPYGSDNFNSGLNTGLWNLTYANGQPTSGVANVSVSGGQLVYTSTDNSNANAYLVWGQSLPSAQSWLATVDVNVTNITVPSDGYASASLYVTDLSSGDDIGDKLAINHSDGHTIVSNINGGSDDGGTGVTLRGSEYTSLTNLTLAIGFNASNDTLTRGYPKSRSSIEIA
ncbi:MAG: hypothetical protein WDO13_10795 [Verrucomicrobiota bacterium]